MDTLLVHKAQLKMLQSTGLLSCLEQKPGCQLGFDIRHEIHIMQELIGLENIMEFRGEQEVTVLSSLCLKLQLQPH
jgi:hypothetical protein